VPVRISRGKSLQGPAKIELIVAPHLRGIRAEPVVIPAEKTTGTLTLRFAPDAKGPFNIPVLIRGTVLEKGKPVVGETKLELLPRSSQ
jgi:hypothetical protein